MFADPRTMGQPQISVTALGERFGFGTSESETEVMSSLAVHLALDAALITTKADQGDAAQWLQHDFNLPAVLKIAFFLQKQCEDSLREVSESAAKTRKKFEKLQANRIKVKEARQQNVEQAIVNLQPDDVTREQKLSTSLLSKVFIRFWAYLTTCSFEKIVNLWALNTLAFLFSNSAS